MEQISGDRGEKAEAKASNGLALPLVSSFVPHISFLEFPVLLVLLLTVVSRSWSRPRFRLPVSVLGSRASVSVVPVQYDTTSQPE